MIRLGVNVDHVATVRQARRAQEPDPVAAAILAELGGADQITIHLREDRRHIQDRDLEIMRRTVRTRLNLEMALSAEIIEIALRAVPDQVTLVPERRQELTTEGGLDAAALLPRLKETIPRFREKGIRVSLFVGPAEEAIRAGAEAGAEAVELHTGAYAEAAPGQARRAELKKLREAATLAADCGLEVVAGHGLTYTNILPLKELKELAEVNIGHTIISRAVLVGMERAVREMKELLR